MTFISSCVNIDQRIRKYDEAFKERNMNELQVTVGYVCLLFPSKIAWTSCH